MLSVVHFTVLVNATCSPVCGGVGVDDFISVSTVSSVFSVSYLGLNVSLFPTASPLTSTRYEWSDDF